MQKKKQQDKEKREPRATTPSSRTMSRLLEGLIKSLRKTGDWRL